MRKIELIISIIEYEHINELNKDDQELVLFAEKSVATAYAPYSLYHVGAALRLENGKIICGNNQENVAYPSGLCAERVAIFYASSQFPDLKIETIAIAAKAQNFEIEKPVAPCGACRQVIAEYETKQKKAIRILLKGNNENIQLINSIEDILPLMFKAEELKKK